MKPSETSTVELLISTGKVSTDLNYKKLSYNEKLNDMVIIPSYNVCWDYIDNMKDDAVKVELTDSELFKYKYKPKLLARDVYGNPELYFIILAINDMVDVTEFDSKRILMLKYSTMQKYISSIYNSEYKYLQKYGN